MKKITLLLTFMLAAVTGSYGQSAASYSFVSSSGAYADNSAAATLLPLVRADTYISPAQNIGFTFVYEGINYTQFTMSSNGFISFNATGASSLTTNNLSSANAASRPIIAPLWDDMDGSVPPSSVASYELTGVSPNRVLTVEWRNWQWNYSVTTPVISFQVKLYETTNVIQFMYRQEATAVSAGSASIGIGSATGSGAGSYLNVTSVSTPAVSSTSSVTTISTKPATGQIFTFTPPNPCTGTPTAGTVAPAIQNLCNGVTPSTLVATGFTTGATGITFQWEESNDNGVGDAWANAVGGTGATTTSYIPPAFSGTTIYYRLNVTCTASVSSAQTASVVVSPPANPATQVTALSGAPGTTSSPLNWTNGNGGRRVVYVSNSPVFTDPVNGNTAALVANSVYGGSGQQIIYDGTAATTTVTGLTPSTTYYVKVYEYLRCGAGPYDFYYNVSTGTNIATITTIAPPANDDCLGAIPLTVGGVFAQNSVAGTVFGGTKTAGITPSCQTNFSVEVWYSVVVPISGTLTLEAQVSPTNSMSDSVIAAFSGTCGALVAVGCDDDSGPAGANNLMSVLSLTGRTPGETLYVGLFKYDSTITPTLANSGFLISAYDASLTAASFDATGFSAYPNPVKDILNLSYSKNISSVSVHNLLGQEVMAKTVNATQSKIDMSNLSNGTYLVKVTVDGLVKTLKVIKQ